MNPVPLTSRTKRKKLYTQTSILSQTPVETPQMIMTAPPAVKPGNTRTKKKKQKTKLVMKNSFYVAEHQENSKPAVATAVAPDPKKPFKPPPKRMVRSMHVNHRRSSIDFITPQQNPTKAEKNRLTKRRIEVCVTSCPRDDQRMVKDVINRIGSTPTAKITSQVLPSTTTHLICGDEGRRTLNMLRAILCGCWIVSLDWVYQCLDQETWVDEEPFEMVSFSAAVKQRRLERDLLPQSNLFKDLDSPMYIGRNCRVPKKELVELIQMAGGKCVNQVRMAKIILAHDNVNLTDRNQVSVTENWLLDSIQQHCVLPFGEYLLQANLNEN